MNYLVKLFVGKYGKSVLRTLLAMLSGYLIRIGLPASTVDNFIAHVDPVITGVVIYLFAQVTSLVDKKKNQE